MAYKLISQTINGTQVDTDGNVLFTNLYYCDSASDITDLPETGIAAGSKAYIPSTDVTYYLYDEDWVTKTVA